MFLVLLLLIHSKWCPFSMKCKVIKLNRVSLYYWNYNGTVTITHNLIRIISIEHIRSVMVLFKSVSKIQIRQLRMLTIYKESM